MIIQLYVPYTVSSWISSWTCSGTSHLAFSPQDLWSNLSHPLWRASSEPLFSLKYSNTLRIRGLKDTWGVLPGATTEQSRITHGTFFYIAREEGLLSNTSIHAGIRCKLSVSISHLPLSILHPCYFIRAWKISRTTNRSGLNWSRQMTLMTLVYQPSFLKSDNELAPVQFI